MVEAICSEWSVWTSLFFREVCLLRWWDGWTPGWRCLARSSLGSLFCFPDPRVTGEVRQQKKGQPVASGAQFPSPPVKGRVSKDQPRGIRGPSPSPTSSGSDVRIPGHVHIKGIGWSALSLSLSICIYMNMACFSNLIIFSKQNVLWCQPWDLILSCALVLNQTQSCAPEKLLAVLPQHPSVWKGSGLLDTHVSLLDSADLSFIHPKHLPVSLPFNFLPPEHYSVFSRITASLDSVAKLWGCVLALPHVMVEEWCIPVSLFVKWK